MKLRRGPVSISLLACGKTFADGTRAVEPVDLAIAPGETIVLLGPSGCGKTTLLRIVAGLETPNAGGRVLFDGADVTRLPIEQRNIGMVFQSYALFPNMSVAENVGYGMRIRRVSSGDISRRVGEMLEMMRISGLADRRIDQLSGGQRQRVALARALAVEPRALLLDEPLTALDAKLREELRIEIDDLLRRLGVTSVYVTHDQTEAMALADRIVVMDRGRVAQVGTPRDIYERPQSTFVAGFIGTMNRVRGAVRDGALVAARGVIPWPSAPAGAKGVLFRPEDARPTQGPPHLTGTVVAVAYLGDRTRLLVDVGEAKPLVIDADPRSGIARGSEIGLLIDARGLVAAMEGW